MISVAEAQDISRRLLAEELPQRWRHVQGVAGRAETSGVATGGTLEILVVAAWLHDIGYAPGLVDTGFHPIDGGRFLRRQGIDERIVGLVAHHSCAHIEARLRDLHGVLEDEFPRNDELPHDELCFCDLTTSPDGELVDVEVRLAEIYERYGRGHLVARFVDEAGPDLVSIVRSVEARLAAQPR